MLAAAEPTRSNAITNFLVSHGYGDVRRDPLKGDASFRRYERLWRGDQSYMLMDAPPPREDVRPFIHVTQLLQGYQLSAPRILAADETQGFLILEDFGSALYSAVLREQPSRELPLYLAATDVLAHLYQASYARSVALAPYDHAVLMREVALLADWFLPQVVGKQRAQQLKPDYLALWRDALSSVELQLTTPALRDYHADNLMWLPDREGLQRVGLLDYQDALLGDGAYDLVSFLEDIRRVVSAETIEACLRHYLDQTGQRAESFMPRYALLGAQRNTKIVGIFTRLCVRDGKAHYLAMLPHVWAWLARDLEHPALAGVKAWVDQHIPVAARGVFEADVSLGSIE